jgi:heme-degrading monooxygenase HmoA
MIRVLYRWQVIPGAEEAFAQAWTRGTRAIQETFQGAQGSFLLRDQLDPSAFLAIACWNSVEDCQVFWQSARPDPEAFQIVAAVSTLVARVIFDEVQDLSQPFVSHQLTLPTAAYRGAEMPVCVN